MWCNSEIPGNQGYKEGSKLGQTLRSNTTPPS